MHKKFFSITLLFALLMTGFFFLWKLLPPPISLKKTSFNQLPGWEKAHVRKSLTAFKTSCKVFLKQDPERFVGSQAFDLKARDWYPACRAALAIEETSEKTAKEFFQTWFTPVEFNEGKPVHGLFTGYYMPQLQGSLTKTEEYQVPIYGLPADIITVNLEQFDPQLKNRRIVGRVERNKLVPFHSREEINKGAIQDKAEVLVWVNSHIDRAFLEIQGAGIVELPEGKQMYIGYAGENGAPYKSIARVLIDKGIMTKDNASMQAIKTYLEAHPQEMHAVLNQNKSFVFFHQLPQKAALGAQGVALTPGYSLAIDRKWIPLGAPLWLSTTRPDQQYDDKKTFQRLMIAQDTGGAIRGVVRGDVYWGPGEKATYIAGHMKNRGHYWLLLPSDSLPKLPKLLS